MGCQRAGGLLQGKEGGVVARAASTAAAAPGAQPRRRLPSSPWLGWRGRCQHDRCWHPRRGPHRTRSYAPPAKELTRMSRLLGANFPGLAVKTLDRQDPRLAWYHSQVPSRQPPPASEASGNVVGSAAPPAATLAAPLPSLAAQPLPSSRPQLAATLSQQSSAAASSATGASWEAQRPGLLHANSSVGGSSVSGSVSLHGAGWERPPSGHLRGVHGLAASAPSGVVAATREAWSAAPCAQSAAQEPAADPALGGVPFQAKEPGWL